MEFMMEDEMFATWETEIAAEYEDPDMIVRIPEMSMKEVLDRIRILSKELVEIGELKQIKTERGLELHQLWVKLKTRERDIVSTLSDQEGREDF
jgi:hypothetical protein